MATLKHFSLVVERGQCLGYDFCVGVRCRLSDLHGPPVFRFAGQVGTCQRPNPGNVHWVGLSESFFVGGETLAIKVEDHVGSVLLDRKYKGVFNNGEADLVLADE